MNIPYGQILVVEDNDHVRELLEVTLRFKGYPVLSAKDGQEAVQHIQNERPALIITDILMPKMDGYTLVHHLRKDANTRQIPVIFISATYVTQEDKMFALSLGAARFIEKPIDTENLLLTIAEIMTGSEPSKGDLLSDLDFFAGYRKRLEEKLQHKNRQILRTERLLQTLPDEQKKPFETLLEDAKADQSEIQKELDDLISQYDELNGA